MARARAAVRPICCVMLAIMIASAIICFLLQAAQPSPVTNSGVFRVRILDSASLSPVNVSATEDITEDTTPKLADTAPGEPKILADADQSSPQGVNGYLPVSVLSAPPELVIDIDPDWYLHGLDLPSLSALLLINEYGDVDDLVIDTPVLTPMLLEDLRTRFRAARFLPGRLHGQAVKVALRVVIQLE
jgi:hypothetical protein